MSENMKRQPAGIPVGGQFAANEHDEAGVSLSVGQVEKTNDGSALSNAYPIDFPMHDETSDKVDWALENDAVLIVDTDMGALPLYDHDLRQMYDGLAPGEGFEVTGAYRKDVEKDKNLRGASAEAIAAADKVSALLRAGDPKQEGADMIAKMTLTPEGKGDYYAALSSYSDLTTEASDRLDALMSEHDVKRADVDLYIAGEFGMPVEYVTPQGETAFFHEHPNRIINRIDDDYLDEIVRFTARDKYDS